MSIHCQTQSFDLFFDSVIFVEFLICWFRVQDDPYHKLVLVSLVPEVEKTKIR
jgi:hypothetical protein